MIVTTEKIPARRLIVKRGQSADNYFDYCEEVGCQVWDDLLNFGSAEEPVSLWLPPDYVPAGTSSYVQGVVYDSSMDRGAMVGYSVIDFPATEYLRFQGEPYDDADYAQAIEQVQQFMDQFDPSSLGYVWDDTEPRIQLEPIGQRGYIELRAVKKTP